MAVVSRGKEETREKTPQKSSGGMYTSPSRRIKSYLKTNFSKNTGARRTDFPGRGEARKRCEEKNLFESSGKLIGNQGIEESGAD